MWAGTQGSPGTCVDVFFLREKIYYPVAIEIFDS